MLSTTTSIKLYGKINEAEQARLDARRRTIKRITIIAISSIVLVAIVVAAVVGTSQGKNGGTENQSPSLATSVKAVCDVTLYKDSCYTSLASVSNSTAQIQPQELFKLSIQVAKNEISKASTFFANKDNLLKGVNDTGSVEALKNCIDLLGLAIDHLDDSFSSSSTGSVFDSADDLKTWLSSVSTCHETCIDGFKDDELKGNVRNYLKHSTELSSNSLAIITWMSKVASSLKLRRLMSFDEPEWVNSHDRKLLQVKSSSLIKRANIVVAKDGSSKYRTIQDALKAVPDKSEKRFVIYVKKGVYTENVRVEKPKWNVMVVGDGMNLTIVSGRLNVVDGTPTFSTATFAVFGRGFIARDIGFRNTAGPSKHQAVALMSTADQSVFYRCQIDAFQDSLYAHSNRQFYRECNIYGTVDFIFGNSAVVLQNCNIKPKKPMPGQKNTITAQGKVDPNQNTGISIHNCAITPYENLGSVQTFLGRPWKNYSTTVYMNSMMGGLIDSKGWLPWIGDDAPRTIYYAEFQNIGPGSSTKNRVKWKGLRSISAKEANKFTVKSFLHGNNHNWIRDAGVTYKSGL